MHNENEPPPTLTFPLRVKRILVIGEGQELHPANLFPTMKNTITNVDTRDRLAEAWKWRYEQSIELDFQVALHTQDWRGNTSLTVLIGQKCIDPLWLISQVY